MSMLPITAAKPYLFIRLVDQIEKARDAVAEATRKLANSTAALEAKQDDADLKKDVEQGEKLLADAYEELDRLEAELEANPDQPVYKLRVPSFDINAAFEEALVRLPTYPGDRKMFRAIEASGLIPSDDPDFVVVKEALKKSGGGVSEDLSAIFQDLYERADNAEAVQDIRAARLRFTKGVARLRTKHYLIGFEGVRDLDGDLVPYLAENGYPTDATINAIPPEDITAIGDKVQELNSLRGRGGNSRRGAKSSASPQPSQPSPTVTETETVETQPTL
ncbi:hypothetical protein [Azospirillum brasilense]|uniref:hypothetical protein n=1 Tax=Azospirillum brasilense TaxID=192 RepID=UPI001EDBC0D2|nr:hypothetical protein [Azospirillum brasilense]UKJ74477.1 hypothetical protein H1Q64_18110 [Azospirillum brasilense]